MLPNSQRWKVRRSWWITAALLLLLLACAAPLRNQAQRQQRHAQVDAQLLQVQALAAQAQQLRSRSSASAQERQLQLQAALQPLLAAGSSWQQQGDEGVLTLQAVPALVWIQALQQLREQAGVRVQALQVQLQQERVSGRVQLKLLAEAV